MSQIHSEGEKMGLQEDQFAEGMKMTQGRFDRFKDWMPLEGGGLGQRVLYLT